MGIKNILQIVHCITVAGQLTVGPQEEVDEFGMNLFLCVFTIKDLIIFCHHKKAVDKVKQEMRQSEEYGLLQSKTTDNQTTIQQELLCS